jgi:hypothetical protein
MTSNSYTSFYKTLFYIEYYTVYIMEFKIEDNNE